MTTKRILIIDDEADIREATQMCLEITGEWEVVLASSGPEGLLKAAKEKPDAILLDIMMPGMDGLTTMQRLRENSDTAAIPIILLTAKSSIQRTATTQPARYRGNYYQNLTIPTAYPISWSRH